jgi:hypothetical protein
VLRLEDVEPSATDQIGGSVSVLPWLTSHSV